MVLLSLAHRAGMGVDTGTEAARYCKREWAHKPDATVDLRSVNHDGQQEWKLHMLNTCADEVVIYWMNLNGEEVELKRLKPGRKTSMLTATGHAFRVYFADSFTTDLPTSALPGSTSRQLAMEHTVRSEHNDEADEWVEIAPCGADATPFHRQPIRPTVPTDVVTGAKLPNADSNALSAPAITTEASSATLNSAHAEDQRRLLELEQQLQRHEAEASARQAEQEAREHELRVTLEQAQAAARQQEEQARLATEAAAAAMAQAASASAPVQQHSEVKVDTAEADVAVTASVALMCMLATTAAWLYSQLRKSASAKVELLQQLQQQAHAGPMSTSEADTTVAGGGETGKVAGPSASSNVKLLGSASTDLSDDSMAVLAPQWTTAAMRKAAAAVNKEQSSNGDANCGDNSKRHTGSAEAALRATEEQLRAALAAGVSGSAATQPQSYKLDEDSSPRTPQKLPATRPGRSPMSSPISPQSSLSELESKLRELGSRDGRLGKMLLEASAQGILNSPSTSVSSQATARATEPAILAIADGNRNEEPGNDDEPPEFDDAWIGTSAKPSSGLIARVVSRGRPGEDI